MKTHLGLGLLLIAVTAILINGASGGFYLDDLPNLTAVLGLAEHGCSDTEKIWRVITSNASGPLGRPLSMASFVASACLLDATPYSFKIVNIGLHLACGILVFVLTCELTRYQKTNHRLTALLATGFWLSAPLLVSTTLYSVQRMTQLSTILSLVAILFYIRSRQAFTRNSALGHLLLAISITCTIAGILAKETALLTPLLIALIELSLLKKEIPLGKNRSSIIFYHTLTWIIPTALIGISLIAAPEKLLNFSGRDFTLNERILTEPRILLDYMQQLVAPQHLRMGVYQDDFPISSSLYHPISTIPSILTVTFLIIAGVLLCQQTKFRPVGIGILFFFVGHSLESTIFPLELYFEHRNYLPSVGLFIAIAHLLTPKILHEKAYGLLLAIGLIGVNLYLTYSISVTWGNNAKFAERAISQHYRSARALSEAAELLTTPQNYQAAVSVTDLNISMNPEKAASTYLQRILIECRITNATTINGKRLEEYLSLSKNDTYAIRIAVEALNMQISSKSCNGLSAKTLAPHLLNWFNTHLKTLPIQKRREAWLLLLTISETLALSENINATITLLQEGLKDSPQNPILMISLAENLIAVGSFPEAEKLLNAAYRIIGADQDAPNELKLHINTLLQKTKNVSKTSATAPPQHAVVRAPSTTTP